MTDTELTAIAALAMIGAFLGESWKGRDFDASLEVGKAAFVGRLLGSRFMMRRMALARLLAILQCGGERRNAADSVNGFRHGTSPIKRRLPATLEQQPFKIFKLIVLAKFKIPRPVALAIEPKVSM